MSTQPPIPNQDAAPVEGAQPTPVDQQPASTWLDSAQGQGAAQTPPQSASAQPTQPAATPQQGNTAAQPAPAAPVVITPVQKPGMMGVMDRIVDALAGKTSPEYATDSEGNKYVKERTMSRGEQWARIAGEGLVGAAAGLANGRGAGNMGKAAFAGVQEGQKIAQDRNKQADEMTNQADKEKLANANNQLLRMKIVQQGLAAKRMGVEATQHDITFQNNLIKHYQDEGGHTLGTMGSLKDISDILKVNPDVISDMIQKHQIEIVPHTTTEGVQDGITVIKMPDSYRAQMLPAGATFHTFDQSTGQYTEHKSADPITQGEIDDYDAKAAADALTFNNKKAQDAHLAAQTAEANENVKKGKSDEVKNYAEANKANAEANKAAKSDTDDAALVDEIGTGKMAAGRLAYIMGRKPEILDAVAKKYPGFDSSKVEAYSKTYEDFTSGKIGQQLNAGATALQHLRELRALNTNASHIPGTPAYNAYQNKADTLSTELAQFYGDTTIPAIRSIKDTLTKTIYGNRDKAIATQAQSMGDKLDNYEQQWNNAAPSKSYEAPMPAISAAAMEARAEMDPKFAQRLKPQPGEPTATDKDGNTLVVRNGQWVKATK